MKKKKKKEERRKTKNDTQNKKKGREYARAISGIAVACVYLFMTKGTRDNVTTRMNGPLAALRHAASSGAASRALFSTLPAFIIAGRQRGLPFRTLRETSIKLGLT